MWWQLVAMPVVGGAIGWFTNFLAIRMLFRPRRAWRVLGLRIQGVIPQRRAELAERVAEAVERDLFSHDDIRQAVLDPDYQEALRSRVEGHLHDYLAERLAAAPRLLQRVLGGGFVGKLARGGAQEVMAYLPTLLEGAAADLEAHFDIRQVIRSKIDAFDLERLESLVTKIARRELRFIEILGGLVGAAVALLFVAVQCLLA